MLEWSIDSLRLTKYNGGNHSISGIKIKHPERDTIGFVRYFKYSTIANLTFKDFEIEGRDYVGAIAGYGSSGFIHNVRIEGSVKGNNIVGGVAGYSWIALTNVVSNAEVSGKNEVGGLIGKCSSYISYSVSNANVEGDSLVGGICGVTKSEQTYFFNVYSIANVKAKTNGSMVANSADEYIKGAAKLFYKKSDFDDYDRGGTALDDSFMKSDAFLDSLPLTFIKDTAANIFVAEMYDDHIKERIVLVLDGKTQFALEVIRELDAYLGALLHEPGIRVDVVSTLQLI